LQVGDTVALQKSITFPIMRKQNGVSKSTGPGKRMSETGGPFHLRAKEEGVGDVTLERSMAVGERVHEKKKKNPPQKTHKPTHQKKTKTQTKKNHPTTKNHPPAKKKKKTKKNLSNREKEIKFRAKGERHIRNAGLVTYKENFTRKAQIGRLRV